MEYAGLSRSMHNVVSSDELHQTRFLSSNAREVPARECDSAASWRHSTSCAHSKRRTCALWVVRARCASRSRSVRDQRVLRIMKTPMSSAERP